MKLNRNDLCWCGSQQKYKKCHLQFDEKLEQLKQQGKIIPLHQMIKNNEQIEGIKQAAIINSGLLDYIEENIKAGMSTEEIDIMAKEFTAKYNAVCADYQYCGYPKHICVSINDVVCHGIPSENEIIQDGDIVNVDATTMFNGYYADASRMFMIGNVTDEAKNLVQNTKKALELAIDAIVPYQSCVGDIGKTIEKFAIDNGYSVVKEFCGHGVGLAIHENPYIFHFEPNEPTVTLVPGMVFTIEPMLNLGKADIFVDADDEWTVFTEDGSLSAQWEHTLLITETGVEILSK
ncbi:methionyl aminopeptidase [Thomasclavelia cocleata]|jgi:methionyl aminopeptidase|uniref:Methionine aminopeptidase n=1 Tax=Thomasclavelia cocleata TaxID=69824 RepID=A0A1I0GHR1_9FIRM|nr:methionyl aminopeptidase [Thomasclavelia cocleata]MCI9132330.1 methionyl aminopeptidase [Thomasclavelia cocleata]MCI9631221.1 methionyl aminopeptidase [Thomasclavelia cocleata]MCR1961348.1 methionyl aminopeptidase [Thomasclavelia cocleata]NDO41565.1 methionyl aminopeptidase [Thomasclavelia cocleata]PJN81315.1 type I methionyl aminopeptidase [Thomasclavelia cocleata]